MIKDYILVQTQEQDLDDLAFVDQFWTERWQEAGLDQVGNRYHHLVKREEYQTMKPYLERLPHRAKLLDAGCGHGEWTVFLSEQNFNVIGLDISEPVITALQTRFPNLTFERGDIRHLDFSADRFDGYFSWGAFEHFEIGLQPCIVEAFRVLKPGGYLFITVPFHNLRHILHELRSVNNWHDELVSAIKNGEGSDHASVRFYQWRLTRAELARELVIGGFNVLSILPVQHLEGIKRTLDLDFKFKAGTRSYRMGIRILRRLPASLVAHMIMAVAQKPLS
jgi:SAM-dependent methyltransferase